MKFLPLKPYETLFLLTGVTMLAALPWFENVGVSFWYFAKISYAVGAVLFIINTIKDVRN